METLLFVGLLHILDGILQTCFFKCHGELMSSFVWWVSDVKEMKER